MTPTTTFDKDYSGKRITVTAHFDAPLARVWDAFTNPEMLVKWFAPKPYRAVSKSMDFTEGGHWLYYMLSPKDEKSYGITKYTRISPYKEIEAEDAFCDEQGVIDQSLPQLFWNYDFTEIQETREATIVTITITLHSEADMRKILEMGFEEGYKMGLRQLYALLRG